MRIVLTTLTLCLLTFTAPAGAQPSAVPTAAAAASNPADFSPFDRYFANVHDLLRGAHVRLSREMMRLVAILGAISIVLTFMLGALDERFSPLPALVSKLLLFTVTAWFINEWDVIVREAVSLAGQLGLSAVGDPSDLMDITDPGNILLLGLDTAMAFAKLANEYTLALSPSFVLSYWAIGAAIGLCYIFMAIIVSIALLEMAILSLLTLVLLPFAVLRPTFFIAASAFSWLVSTALRMLVIALILSLFDRFYTELSAGVDATAAALPAYAQDGIIRGTLALFAALLQCVLLLFLPFIVHSLVTGTAGAITTGGVLRHALLGASIAGYVSSYTSGGASAAAGGASRGQRSGSASSNAGQNTSASPPGEAPTRVSRVDPAPGATQSPDRTRTKE